MNRYRFMFSNRQAQKAEAMKNADEARAHLARWVGGEEPQQPAPAAPTDRSTPGQCFRRVSAILARRGK